MSQQANLNGSRPSVGAAEQAEARDERARRRLMVQRALLRVELDRKQGFKTPPDVLRVAGLPSGDSSQDR